MDRRRGRKRDGLEPGEDLIAASGSYGKKAEEAKDHLAAMAFQLRDLKVGQSMKQWGSFYVLDEDKNPVPCDDTKEWVRFMENLENKVVRKTTIENEIENIEVSTVFLGIDHSFSSDGPPILFETMIFGGPTDQEQWRYVTWEDAITDHSRVLEELQGKIAAWVERTKQERLELEEREREKAERAALKLQRAVERRKAKKLETRLSKLPEPLPLRTKRAMRVKG